MDAVDLIAAAALGSVSFRRQILQEIEESVRLPDKEPHRRQEFDRAHRGALRLCGANHRARREAAAQERARLRHDQIGLESFASKRRRIEVGENEPVRRVGQRRRIAGLVGPGLKVHGFGGPDTDQDSQNLHTFSSLGHGGIQAAPALLDGRHVKSRGVRDRLNVTVGSKIRIGPGDGRELPFCETGHRLRENEVCNGSTSWCPR
jgi:hypothetical protein